MRKHSILMSAFVSALSALRIAADAAATADEGVAPGTGSEATSEQTRPSTAVQTVKRIAQPVLDVDKMSEDEVRAALKRLNAQQGSSRGMTKSFRFNDGTAPTKYEKGDKILDASGKPTGKIAKGGEVKSPRSSGTYSIYGFGKNPVSLYPSQWIELAFFMPDIIRDIHANADHIDEYLQEHSKGRADLVNREALSQLLEQFTAPDLVVKLQGELDAATELLAGTPGDSVADDESNGGELADEVGGEA